MVTRPAAEALPAHPQERFAAQPREQPPRTRRVVPWDVEDPAFASYFVRLSDVIGRGADGVVLRARPKNEDTTHAIKVVRRQAHGLEAELVALRCLAERPHKHVVRLLAEFPPHGPRPQHMMAFAEADMDLRQFLQRPVGARACRPLADALGGQLLGGIAHLHKLRLLHRDLKPANILVFWEQPGPRDTAGSVSICLQIADFSRTRLLAGVRVRANTSFPKSSGPLTCGGATWGYAAPEALCEDEPVGKTAEYGFGVDMWSFGCIYFEMVEKQRFVPEDSLMGCRRRIEQRLGPPARGLGLWPPPHGEEDPKAVAELEAHHSVAFHPWIAGTLRWREEERRSGPNLLQVEHAALPSASHANPRGGGGTASVTAATPARTPHATVGAVPEAVVGDSLLQESSPQAVQVVQGKCKCAGHCYQPGHRSRGGCDCKTVVAGSGYCQLCVCSVVGCHRPRLRGPFCFGHGKVAGAVPPECLLVRCSTRALPSMLATVTTLPHYVGRTRVDRDLGSLVLAGLTNSTSEMDMFQVNFGDDRVTDEELVAELKRQYNAAAADAAEPRPGRQGSRCNGTVRPEERTNRGPAVRAHEWYRYVARGAAALRPRSCR